jgi:hypothetical protein
MAGPVDPILLQVGPAIASGKWYNYDDHSTVMHAICEK